MKIDSFSGQYHFLSNFYPAPVDLDGESYPTVEHAYQAAKTHDPVWRLNIREAPTAAAAEWMGKKIPKSFFRSDWDAARLGVMERLLIQKFGNRRILHNLLVATGDAELIEGNTWGDTFWGVYNGTGENHLGKLLMEIRHFVRKS